MRAAPKLLFVFPPGWNMNVGSPHLAIPLLQAVAKKSGAEVFIKDLNWEISEYFGVKPTIGDIYSAVEQNDLDSLNKPYFDAEDKLMSIAWNYKASWNIQLGFQYKKFTSDSSSEVLNAANEPTPVKDYYERRLLPYIKGTDPNIICLSIASPGQLIPAFQLCHLLRKYGYDGLIVMGGNIISRLRNAVNNPELYRIINLFAFYQGEINIAKIIGTLEKGKSEFSSVPNIAYFNGLNVTYTPLIERIDLQQLPPPDFDGFPLEQYWGINYLPLVAARGCYHGRCHFCAIPFGWNSKGFAGVRNVDFIYNDMLQLNKKYGFTRFKFVDEAMIPNVMAKVANQILNANLLYEWEGYARLESIWLDEEFVKTVAESGLRKCYFGLEIYPTGNRKALNKKDAAQPEKLLQICQKHGIKVHFFCLIGFPGTGKYEAEETIDFILRNANLIDTVDIYRFGYMRHTTVPGVKPIIDSAKDWAMEYEWVPDNNGVLTRQEAEKIKVELEEIVWSEYPKLLHPTYRLLSPWTQEKPNENSMFSKTPGEKTSRVSISCSR